MDCTNGLLPSPVDSNLGRLNLPTVHVMLYGCGLVLALFIDYQGCNEMRWPFSLARRVRMHANMFICIWICLLLISSARSCQDHRCTSRHRCCHDVGSFTRNSESIWCRWVMWRTSTLSVICCAGSKSDRCCHSSSVWAKTAVQNLIVMAWLSKWWPSWILFSSS